MFGIYEFSRLTQISVMMLQYYANAGILKPDLVDFKTGRKYYQVEQIEIAEKINTLRNFGFSVSEISTLQNHWDNASIICEVNRKKALAESEILELKRRIKEMDQYNDRLSGAIASEMGAARLKRLSEQYIYSVRLTNHISRSEGMLWQRLKQCLAKQEIDEQGTYLMVCYDSEYKDQLNDMELGIVVKSEERSLTEAVYRKVEATEAVCCRIMGGEDKLRRGFISIAEWLEANPEYSMGDSVRKIYRKNSNHSKGTEQRVVELQVPVQIR